MGQVGHPPEPLPDLGVEGLEPVVVVAPLPLELLPLGDEFRALRGVFFTTGRLRNLVLPAAEVFHRQEQTFPLGIERDDAVDLGDDLITHVPVAAVLLDEVDVGGHEFEVEHAKNPTDPGSNQVQGVGGKNEATAIGPRMMCIGPGWFRRTTSNSSPDRWTTSRA